MVASVDGDTNTVDLKPVEVNEPAHHFISLIKTNKKAMLSSYYPIWINNQSSFTTLK